MTLGAAAKAGVRIIVWCKACRHQTQLLGEFLRLLNLVD
jgi:hypothetical protein